MNLEQLIENNISDSIIHGCSILAGNQHQTLYRQSFGFAENSHSFPFQSNTVIDIASCTKAIATITALLRCKYLNLIDFSAPFTNYLPDFKPLLKYPVSISDLANHTSGFRDVPGEKQRRYFAESGQEILHNMLHIPPPFPPGGNASYACWNYILLAMIIEKITQSNFIDFCNSEIFIPLGMHDTALGKPPAVPPERLGQTIGTDHPGQISDFIASRIYRDGGTSGNAGLFSSADDLAKILRCYLAHGRYNDNKYLFGENEFNEIKPDTAQNNDGYRRFGWIIKDDYMCAEASGSSLLHSGWSGQTVFMNFKKNIFIIVLTTRCGDYDRAKATRFAVINQIFNQL